MTSKSSPVGNLASFTCTDRVSIPYLLSKKAIKAFNFDLVEYLGTSFIDNQLAVWFIIISRLLAPRKIEVFIVILIAFKHSYSAS